MLNIVETVKTHKTQSALIGVGAILTVVGAILFAKAKKTAAAPAEESAGDVDAATADLNEAAGDVDAATADLNEAAGFES